MRAWVLGVLGLALLAWAATATGAGLPPVGGKIINSDNQTIEVKRFLNLMPEYVCMVDEAQTSIPIIDIRSLEHKEGNIIVVTVKGKTITATGDIAVSLTDFIEYQAINPATGQPEQSEIDCELVNQIVFNWQQAEDMKCPQCGRDFPADYRFCPYDGTKLVPAKP